MGVEANGKSQDMVADMCQTCVQVNMGADTLLALYPVTACKQVAVLRHDLAMPCNAG